MFRVSSVWVFPPLHTMQKTKPAEEMDFSFAAEMQRLKKVLCFLCYCESIFEVHALTSIQMAKKSGFENGLFV